jgi:glutathione S-transferase
MDHPGKIAMSLALHAHPFSSYCQKVLIALYENDIPFDLALIDFGDPKSMAAFEALWPVKRMPVLVDGDKTVMESSIIIEHLELHHGGNGRLIPADPSAALDVRFMDRFFDGYVMTPMQRIVSDSFRAADKHDEQGVAGARSLLDTSYRWLEKHMAGREWASGDGFTMADCAAGPALYADWVHQIPAALPNVRAYRGRLLARPSFDRVVNEARQYRSLFPLGAPDRD